MADAGKHRGLGRLPEVKGAEPHMVRTGSIMLLLGAGSGPARLAYFLVLNDGSLHNMDAVLRTAVDYWLQDLSDKNLPVP